MTSARFVLGDPRAAQPWLRLAGAEEQEALREWKNGHRDAFFHTAVITPEGQRQWFQGYRARPEDFLFLVMERDRPVGCMGVRLLDAEWDVYNVIRGASTASSRGFMGLGLRMLVAFARDRRDLPVQAVVLANNPAVDWYLRQGFRIVGRRPDSVVMRWAAVAPLETGQR
jgi:ribosomal protein S18 acetylase RimI-like enzyme